MADRFATDVEIGGPLTQDQLRRITVLAAEAGMSCDWQDVCDPMWIIEHLTNQIRKGEHHITVDNYEMYPDGEQELTKYLCEQGIPWNKRVDGKYEYDAEFTWWRPGMDGPQTWDCMSMGCRNVTVRAGLLKEWRNQGHDLDWVIKTLDKIGPEMPPVALVEDAEPPEGTTGMGHS